MQQTSICSARSHKMLINTTNEKSNGEGSSCNQLVLLQQPVSSHRSLTPSKKNCSQTQQWHSTSNEGGGGNFLGTTSCCNLANSSLNEEGIDSQIGTLESTDGHCTYTTGAASAFVT